MVSFLKKVDIYKIIVDPCRSSTWKGLFNFHPNAEDVATAMLQDINELDEDVEHESDLIRQLRITLELVTYQTPELLGQVSIAGTYVGEISIAIIKVFAQSMMPPIVEAMSEEDS